MPSIGSRLDHWSYVPFPSLPHDGQLGRTSRLAHQWAGGGKENVSRNLVDATKTRDDVVVTSGVHRVSRQGPMATAYKMAPTSLVVSLFCRCHHCGGSL